MPDCEPQWSWHDPEAASRAAQTGLSRTGIRTAPVPRAHRPVWRAPEAEFRALARSRSSADSQAVRFASYFSESSSARAWIMSNRCSPSRGGPHEASSAPARTGPHGGLGIASLRAAHGDPTSQSSPSITRLHIVVDVRVAPNHTSPSTSVWCARTRPVNGSCQPADDPRHLSAADAGSRLLSRAGRRARGGLRRLPASR
jgi:hypothetical protein